MEKDLPPVEIRFQLKATLEDSYLIRFLGTLMKKVVGERVSAENCDRIAKGARLMIIGERWNHSPNEPNPNVAKMIRNEKPDLSEVHIDEIIRLLRFASSNSKCNTD